MKFPIGPAYQTEYTIYVPLHRIHQCSIEYSLKYPPKYSWQDNILIIRLALNTTQICKINKTLKQHNRGGRELKYFLTSRAKF